MKYLCIYTIEFREKKKNLSISEDWAVPAVESVLSMMVTGEKSPCLYLDP